MLANLHIEQTLLSTVSLVDLNKLIYTNHTFFARFSCFAQEIFLQKWHMNACSNWIKLRVVRDFPVWVVTWLAWVIPDWHLE